MNVIVTVLIVMSIFLLTMNILYKKRIKTLEGDAMLNEQLLYTRAVFFKGVMDQLDRANITIKMMSDELEKSGLYDDVNSKVLDALNEYNAKNEDKNYWVKEMIIQNSMHNKTHSNCLETRKTLENIYCSSSEISKEEDSDK